MSVERQGEENAPAIVVENLGKTYRVYNGQGRGWVKSVVFPFWKERFSRSYAALSGVDLEIKKGEIWGILGRNGSGKSTLLRLIAGISIPTEGTVTVNGGIRCLLATGISFDPRLTGRQNILYGSVAMGISSEIVQSRMDEIIEFSELRNDIDKPTLFYSDGMRTKLAFAVAFQEVPDILLLDEALSAGDIFFQRKCDQRIHEIVSSGSTVVLATHSMSNVEELCTHAMVLEGGRIKASGSPATVLDRYRDMLADEEAERPKQLAEERFLSAPAQPSDSATDAVDGAAGVDGVELIAADMCDADGVPSDAFDHGEPFELRVRLRGTGEVPMLRVELDLIAEDFGIRAASTGTEHLSAETGDLAVFPIPALTGEHELVVQFPRNPFGSGLYTWTIALRPFDPKDGVTEYFRQTRVAPFRSISFPGHSIGRLRRMLVEPAVRLAIDPEGSSVGSGRGQVHASSG